MSDTTATLEKTKNPFAESENLPAESQDATSLEAVESSRSTAEVQASMAIAKKFPRDNVKAMDRILQACMRPSLAEAAVYAYPRGGQTVSGPSIRLAEALAQNWGNMNFGIRELGQHNRRSTVLAYAWDLETNTRAEKVFEVPHERHTKQGKQPLTDPRDIYEMIANQGARRMRNCILSVLPGDVVEAAVHQCDETQKHAMGAPEDQIERMLKAFGEMEVTKAQIEKRLQHRLQPESTVTAELLSLRKIYNSIKDGYTKVADWFEPAEEEGAQKKSRSAKEKVKNNAAEQE